MNIPSYSQQVAFLFALCLQFITWKNNRTTRHGSESRAVAGHVSFEPAFEQWNSCDGPHQARNLQSASHPMLWNPINFDSKAGWPCGSDTYTWNQLNTAEMFLHHEMFLNHCSTCTKENGTPLPVSAWGCLSDRGSLLRSQTVDKFHTVYWTT